MAGYNISTQKSTAFPYTKNERSAREIKGTLQFTTASTGTQHPGVNLPVETQDLYSENSKMPRKEIKGHTHGWKDVPSSWIGSINTVQMTPLPKAIHRGNPYHITNEILHSTRTN